MSPMHMFSWYLRHVKGPIRVRRNFLRENFYTHFNSNFYFSFDVNSVQLADCVVVVSVMDFNGGVVKDNFVGRVILGKESSGNFLNN